MWKLIPWPLVRLIVGLLVVACLAAGQAITFAWLSSFPERATQLESLRIKFWSYASVSAVLVFIDVILVVRLTKRIKEIRRRPTNGKLNSKN
jgi:membrane protein implicated in regulation of membrane protease activity